MSLPSLISGITSTKTLVTVFAIVVFFSGYIYASDKKAMTTSIEKKADIEIMNTAIAQLKEGANIQRQSNAQFQTTIIELLKNSERQQAQIENLMSNQEKIITHLSKQNNH